MREHSDLTPDDFTPEQVKRLMALVVGSRSCLLPSCDKKRRASLFCRSHERRLDAYGRPRGAPKVEPAPPTALEIRDEMVAALERARKVVEA